MTRLLYSFQRAERQRTDVGVMISLAVNVLSEFPVLLAKGFARFSFLDGRD